MTALNELIEDATSDLKNWMEDNPGADPSEEISEIADSATPIYHADILECAMDDMDLAITVPGIGPAFNGEYTAVNIIAANIYERIEQELWDYYREHEDDWLDEIEDETDTNEDEE